MEYRLTYDEMNLLNALLEHFPQKEKFTIREIHAVHILKPQFTKENNTIDLAKYDAERNKPLTITAYEKITYFLINEGFADYTDTTKISETIVLTRKGEYLKAYSSVYDFYKIVIPGTKKEIESRIPQLIEMISYYGEFIVEPNPPRNTIVDLSDFLTANPEEALKRVKEALDQKEHLKREYKQLGQDEEVLQYLVDNGFAINRHDIKIEGQIYRQLTDKGRQLKELGNIEAYWAVKKDKEDQVVFEAARQAKEAQRNKYLFWITFFIGVSTVLAAVYYVLEIFRIQYHLGLPHHIFFG